jgi:hypothetical protein
MNMLPEEAGTDYNRSEKKAYPEYPVLGRKEEKEERRDMAGEKEIVGEDDTTVKQLDKRVLQANQPWRRGKRHKINGSHPGADHERI